MNIIGNFTKKNITENWFEIEPIYEIGTVGIKLEGEYKNLGTKQQMEREDDLQLE